MNNTTIIEELSKGNSFTYFTIGVSMRPLLKERKTHVMINPIDSLKKYDIVLYVRDNHQYVLHRLLRIDNEYYYMRGDNTFKLERIRKDQAIGVVSVIYRHNKYIDVKSNSNYKVYIFFNLISYPIRFVIHLMKRIIRKVLKGLFKK